MKVRTDSAAQVFRLADVDSLSRAIFVEIDAGRTWNFFLVFRLRSLLRQLLKELQGVARFILA